MSNVNTTKFQQRLAAERREIAEREAEEATQLERQARANAEARARYLAKLDAEKAERHAANEAKLEAEIAPERGRAMREWLANHAGKTERDFMAQAWPHLRLNVIAERERQQGERVKAGLRATGRYSL